MDKDNQLVSLAQALADLLRLVILQHLMEGPATVSELQSLGLNLSALRRERRRFAFACPDWTERRPHLGGSLGAALWTYGVERGWVVKQQGTRAIIVTNLGKQQLREQFGIWMEEEPG
jgi:hypothetical protein